MSGNLPTAAPVASGSAPQYQQQQTQGHTGIAFILEQILSAQNEDERLSQYLKNCSKDSRDVVFASLLEDGRDPLEILDATNNTLGYLYVLSARLKTPNASAPSTQIIQNFCERFDPVKARLAPERVTVLGKAIAAHFEASNALADSIPPLSALVSRYPPSPSHLTTLRALLARVCAATRRYSALIPFLSTPITEVDLSISDLHYNDNLVYHYAGGMCLAALRRWSEAQECFEVVVGAPAQTPAAIQLEALKKLMLVQLILYGKGKDVPKYVSHSLITMFKRSPYAAFVREYPLKQAVLEQICEKEAETFANDKNTGLIQIALGHARRWAIKRLTATYISLSLAEIGSAVDVADEQAVRTIVQSMIDEHEIDAVISHDRTVTFSDVSATTLSSAQIGALLASAQAQGALLAQLDKKMESNKDFVGKAWKNMNAGGSGGPGGPGDWAADEDMHMTKGAFETWAEDA